MLLRKEACKIGEVISGNKKEAYLKREESMKERDNKMRVLKRRLKLRIPQMSYPSIFQFLGATGTNVTVML